MKININKNLAVLVSMHFVTVLLLAVGLAASLAFILTAKWYMVLFAIVVLSGGWFLLYKFEEGWTARKLQSE